MLIYCMFCLTCVHALKEYKPRRRDNYIKNLIKPNSVGIEIGVWEGAFAYYVLSKTNPEQLYLVDPWKWPPQNTERYGEADPEKDQRIEGYYNEVVRLFENNPNVSVLRMTSLEASTKFPDEFFDFIYVDGDHSYKGVISDLKSYLPKLKSDGILIGDDYGFKSVSSAVNNFIKENKDTYRLVETKYGQYQIRKI